MRSLETIKNKEEQEPPVWAMWHDWPWFFLCPAAEFIKSSCRFYKVTWVTKNLYLWVGAHWNLLWPSSSGAGCLIIVCGGSRSGGIVGQIAGVHNITHCMILDSKSCVWSMVTSRAVEVFNRVNRSSVDGLGHAAVVAKFDSMQILGGNCRPTCPMWDLILVKWAEANCGHNSSLECLGYQCILM